MKRSDLDAAIDRAAALAGRFGFPLPPFAGWSREEWLARADALRPTLERGIGWDVTDFGRGDFPRVGLCLLTLRNGTLAEQRAGRGQTYAEKLMLVGVGQETPFHLHRAKTEDIINRGGGDLVLELFDPADPARSVRTFVDGVERDVAPRARLRLPPGGSVQVPIGVQHRFWAEGEDALAQEVSSVNDDADDNEFLVPAPRYPVVEEDVPARRLLVGEYAALGSAP